MKEFDRDLVSKYADELLAKASPEFLKAFVAGVPMVYEYNPETETMKVTTKFPIAVEGDCVYVRA